MKQEEKSSMERRNKGTWTHWLKLFTECTNSYDNVENCCMQHISRYYVLIFKRTSRPYNKNHTFHNIEDKLNKVIQNTTAQAILDALAKGTCLQLITNGEIGDYKRRKMWEYQHVLFSTILYHIWLSKRSNSTR